MYLISIKVWNLNTGECLKTFTDSLQRNVTYMEAMPDDKIIYVFSDNNIEIWDMNTDKQLHILCGHRNKINCVQLLSNTSLISNSEDKSIRVWCLRTNRCIKTIQNQSKNINSIQLIADNRVVCSLFTKKIKVWDLESAKCLRTILDDFFINDVQAF